MKTYYISNLILAVLLINSCSSSEFTVFSHNDSIDSEKKNYGSTEFIIYQSPPTEANTFDILAKFSCEKSTSNTTYNMIVKYSGTTPIYFEHMELATGSDNIKLEPQHLPMRRQDGVTGIAEVISVPINEIIIQNLLAARNAELRVRGESVTIQFFLQNDFYNNLSKFYSETKL